jgi:adenylate cyclase
MGINSGPVIGGVIGRKKFVYDIWGDAVNVASRMESQGVAGQIQVTRATYELICEEFLCEPRGLIEIKGRGEMDTYFLVGRKSGHE